MYNFAADAACVCDWAVYDLWQAALRIEIWIDSAHARWVAGALHCAAMIRGARLLRKILRSQLC